MFSLIDEKAEAEKDPVAHHLYGQQLPGHRQASGGRWFYLCIPLSCTSLIQGEKGVRVRGSHFHSARGRAFVLKKAVRLITVLGTVI